MSVIPNLKGLKGDTSLDALRFVGFLLVAKIFDSIKKISNKKFLFYEILKCFKNFWTNFVGKRENILICEKK